MFKEVDEFGFVVKMYKIRCESEGLEPRNPNAKRFETINSK